IPKKADTTSAVRPHSETPPSPAWVRASRPAGWLPPRPTRRPTGRLWRQGCRKPGRYALSDRVARQPRSTRRHPRLPASPPSVWRSDPRQELLSRGQAQSGAQRNGPGADPKPTERRHGSGGRSHPVRKHAYLSCSMILSGKEAPQHVLRAPEPVRCSFIVQECEGRASRVKVLVPLITCIRTVSISGACRVNESRSARK